MRIMFPAAALVVVSLLPHAASAQCADGSCGGVVVDGGVVDGGVVYEDGGCSDGSCGTAGCSTCGAGGKVVGGVRGLVGLATGGLVTGAYVGDLPQETVVYGQRRAFGQPDLFYNYYTQGNANLANAQMYLSPLPVPPNVGHTFNTYQPFSPHHYLYWHKDRYHNYYDGGRGMNRTRAVYYAPPVKTAVTNLYWNYLRIPR